MTNILDNPEIIEVPKEDFKSRVPQDLMIVVGVLLTLLGAYFVYLFIDTFFMVLDRRTGNEPADHMYQRILVMNSVSFFYGLVLFVAGIGLIWRKKIGWIFGLASATYPIFVVVIGFIRTIISNTPTWPGVMWAAFFVVLFSVLMITFLLSKPLRNYFKPTKKEYGISALIVISLVAYLLVIPLLT